MTNADVFCTVLSEVTGRPAAYFRALLATLPADKRGRLDEECENAQTLLPALLAERSGILNRLLAGRREAHRSTGRLVV